MPYPSQVRFTAEADPDAPAKGGGLAVATTGQRGEAMKSGIHPEYVETQVTCSCGSTFTTRSTAKNGVIHADVCSQCHPFYTGRQKILDAGGRVAKFEKRFGGKGAKDSAAAAAE